MRERAHLHTPPLPATPSSDREGTLELRHPTAPSSLLLTTADRPPISLESRRSLIVGSARGADLQVHDPAVSGHHARLVRDGAAWMIEDLGSTNGTFVDEVQIRQAWLRPNTTLRLGRWRGRVIESRAAEADPVEIAGMRGRSPAFLRLLATLRRFAPLPTTVLLRGPTGTGKELAARAIHHWSARQSGPFVALNCGALPEGLCESELFGHVRGAFTGATRGHDGAFARARGGSLFLDEIGELPLHLQATLLRVLETRRVLPVGGEQETAVDVRVIAATHRPIDQWIAEGRFREDLYHRIGVLTVDLPPLAERRGDIPLLLEAFREVIADELGRPVILSPSAISAAEAYPWPGNVRQLRNALLRAAAVSDGSIDAETLIPGETVGAAKASMIAVPRGSYAAMSQALLDEVLRESGSIRKAAKALGIPRSTLGAWLRRGE